MQSTNQTRRTLHPIGVDPLQHPLHRRHARPLHGDHSLRRLAQPALAEERLEVVRPVLVWVGLVGLDIVR